MSKHFLIMNLLSSVWLVKMFSHSVGHLTTGLVASLVVEMLNVVASHLSVPSFIYSATENQFPIQVCGFIFPFFFFNILLLLF